MFEVIALLLLCWLACKIVKMLLAGNLLPTRLSVFLTGLSRPRNRKLGYNTPM